MGIIFAIMGGAVGLPLLVAVLWLAWRVLHFRPRHLVTFVEVLFGVIAGMLMVDRWGEVFDTIRRNKLRTSLTAISVAWGIFVLVALLGLGHGLNNGIRHSFRREASNGIWISANKTSVAYGGVHIRRQITVDHRDFHRAEENARNQHKS